LVTIISAIGDSPNAFDTLGELRNALPAM